MKANIFTFFAILTLSFSACITPWLGNCIEAEGEWISESRFTEPFTGILLNMPAIVRVSQGVPREVRVMAQKNVVNQIRTRVENGVLSLEYDTCIRDADSVVIAITTEYIQRLQINGSGEIAAESLIHSDDLLLKINGSGNIHAAVDAAAVRSFVNGSGDISLSGAIGTHRIEINGSGDLFAGEARTGHCALRINGSGDCDVFVEKNLDIKILGSGEVVYRGTPKMTTSIAGSGKITAGN